MPSQDFSSDDSLSSDPDSEAESQTSSQISFKPKELNTRFMSWRFLDTIQADVLAGEFEDRKRRLIEHFRTRTTPDRPICVLSVTIIAYLKPLILALPNENPTVSIAIIGHVQTKPSRPIAMTKWIPSATWEPVSSGLCSNVEFLADMDRPNDLTLSWYKLPIFGELGLNNLGSIAARDKRKESLLSRSSILIQCRLVTVVFVCRGKPQPIRPRKELSERPSGNE